MFILLYFICGLIGGYIAVKLDHPYESMTRPKLVMIIFLGLFGYITLILILIMLLIILMINISETNWGKK